MKSQFRPDFTKNFFTRVSSIYKIEDWFFSYSIGRKLILTIYFWLRCSYLIVIYCSLLVWKPKLASFGKFSHLIFGILDVWDSKSFLAGRYVHAETNKIVFKEGHGSNFRSNFTTRFFQTETNISKSNYVSWRISKDTKIFISSCIRLQTFVNFLLIEIYSFLRTIKIIDIIRTI